MYQRYSVVALNRHMQFFVEMFLNSDWHFVATSQIILQKYSW